MAKNTLIIFAALLFPALLAAQPGQQRGRAAFEQVEAEKIAFFTRFMELTSPEAKTFWPLYEDFQSEKEQIMRERHSLSRRFAGNYENVTDDEAKDIADRYIELRVKEAGLSEKYHEKFMSVLPPGKVMRFYQAENEFRMQLLRRVRGGGPGRGAGRPDRE